MNIDFVLSQTDSRPMYQQVMGHIKDRVAIGDWPEGMRIPSIRELAVALKVSVITIKRAYQELEHEGILVVQHGRGAFVAKQKLLNKQDQENELDENLRQVVQLANRLGVEPTALAVRLKKIILSMTETIE